MKLQQQGVTLLTADNFISLCKYALVEFSPDWQSDVILIPTKFTINEVEYDVTI